MIRDAVVFAFLSLTAFTPMISIAVMRERPPVEMVPQELVMDITTGQPAIFQDGPAAPIAAPPAPAARPTSVFYGATFDAVVGMLLTGVTGLVGWLSMWWRTLFRADMDQKMRDMLHDGLRNGILFAAARVKAKIEAGVNVDIPSELLANTNQYMNDRSGQVLKYFNLQGKPPEAIKDLVSVNASKLGLSMRTAELA